MSNEVKPCIICGAPAFDLTISVDTATVSGVPVGTAQCKSLCGIHRWAEANLMLAVISTDLEAAILAG
jgi:hypothetical protein